MINNAERELNLYQLSEVDCLSKNNLGRPFQNQVSSSTGPCASGSSAEIEATDVISISSLSIFIPECDDNYLDSHILKRGIEDFKATLLSNSPILFDYPLLTSRRGYDKIHNCINEEVVNALLSKNHRSRPRFNTKMSNCYDCAIVDFDFLPDGYHSWDLFRTKLRLWFNSCGITTASNHNKAKIFFFFDGKITINQKKSFLKSKLSNVFGDNLWTMKVCNDKNVLKSVIDKQGIEASFITLEMLETLRANIDNTILHSIDISSSDIIVSVLDKETQPGKPNWKLYDGDLPDSLSKESKCVKFVFRFLMSYLSKSTQNQGLDLPLKFMASLSGFSLGALSNARKRLVELSVIRKTIGFCPGVKGDTFLLEGFYLLWAKNVYQKLKAEKKGKTLEVIKANFEDGNWNAPLFDLAIYSIRHHWSRETYLETVKGIPGWNDKPERIKQATSAYNSYSKWINRAASISLKIA